MGTRYRFALLKRRPVNKGSSRLHPVMQFTQPQTQCSSHLQKLKRVEMSPREALLNSYLDHNLEKGRYSQKENIPTKPAPQHREVESKG
jgi:hypothetical protein